MANTTIQLKKSGVLGNVPASLGLGEIALNYADGKLYYKNASGVITYISSGATTNSFSTVNSNSSLILATSPLDTLSFVAGNNISISTDTFNKRITISSTATSNGGGTTTPNSVSFVISDDVFTGNGSTTSFSLTSTPTNIACVLVNINGVMQLTSSYTLANNVLTFSEAPAPGAAIEVKATQGIITGTVNNAIDLAQGAFNKANTNLDAIIIIQGVDTTQNTNITSVNQYAQAAYAQANSTVGVDNTQNTNITSVNQYAQAAYALANVTIGVDTTQNTNITSVNQYAASAYALANVTIGVDATQNTNITIIQGVDTTQNTNITTANNAAWAAFAAGNTNATNITLINQYAQAAYAQANSTVGVDATQNTSISIIQGVDLTQNTTITAVNQFAQSAYDSSNAVNQYAASAYAQANSTVGVDATQNTSISIIQGVDVSQNNRMTIIEGVDTTQNNRMTIIEGVDVSQNNRMTIIEGVDVSQNNRIDFSNTAITIIQGVDVSQNANIVSVQALANTDFTTTTSPVGTFGSSTLIPVVTVAANGRVTNISTTTLSGYLANSVIFANATGNLSNTVNLSFYSANNTLVVANAVFNSVTISNTNIALGSGAGDTGQSIQAVAIGYLAGQVSQNAYSVAIGSFAGQCRQRQGAVAIGRCSGKTAQGCFSVAVGQGSGQCNQSCRGIAIGVCSGKITQAQYGIAIGVCAGNLNQKTNGIAIGRVAAKCNQSACSVAIGSAAGYFTQGSSAIAIGACASLFFQNNFSVAVGSFAGYCRQRTQAVAIGKCSGRTAQGCSSIAIGKCAGKTSQNAFSVAIGANAGQCRQRICAVAIGANAGNSNQGAYAVAIGSCAGKCNQVASSVVISGCSIPVNAVQAGFYVAPIRVCTGNTTQVVYYNTSTKELTYTAAPASGTSGYLANSVIFANTTGNLSNVNAISFYTANNTLVVNSLNVTNTNPSISNTTGVLIVSGGVGIAGNVYTSSIITAPGSAIISPIVLTAGTNLTTQKQGAFEYDGAVSYFTPDTTIGRGFVPAISTFRLNAPGNAILGSAANFFGTTSNIPLVSGGFYEIEIYAIGLKGSTAGTVTWTFTNTVAPTLMLVDYEQSPLAGIAAPPGSVTALTNINFRGTTTTTLATYTFNTGTLAASVNHLFKFRILLNNNTGTSLKLQLTAGAGNASVTPQAGSVWFARRLPGANTGTFAA